VKQTWDSLHTYRFQRQCLRILIQARPRSKGSIFLRTCPAAQILGLPTCPSQRHHPAQWPASPEICVRACVCLCVNWRPMFVWHIQILKQEASSSNLKKRAWLDWLSCTYIIFKHYRSTGRTENPPELSPICSFPFFWTCSGGFRLLGLRCVKLNARTSCC